MAIAVFFVAIMIGAAMFVAFHELPHDDETGDGGRVLVWDMNIYKEREATYRYKADALSLQMRFPDSPQMNDVLLKNRMVEVRYEVEDLLFGPMNGHCIQDRPGVVSGNSITYEDVFDNVDLVYIVGANGLKEFLVLKERPRYLSGDLVLRSQLHYPPSALEPYSNTDLGIHREFSTSDTISMYDIRFNEVLRIAPPVVFDSTVPPGGSLSRYSGIEGSSLVDGEEQIRTIDVKVPDPVLPQRMTVGTTRISENRDGASLTTVVPWDFLSASSTRYPVFIDPTISSPITDNQWYQDALIMLESNLSIVSGGSLNLYNVTLQVNHTDVDPYHIEVHSNASFNVYRSVVEPNASLGSEPFEFNSMGDLTVQDSVVNYTLDGINVTTGNCSLRNVTIGHSSGDGVHSSGGNLTLYQLEIHNCSADGIDVSNAEVDIIECEVRDATSTGILLNNVTCNITKTTVTDCDGKGIDVQASDSVNILESHITENSGTGMKVADCSGLIYDNDVDSNLHGLNLTQGTNCTVKENQVSGNTVNGINVIDSSPSLDENIIDNHTSGTGLYISNSTPTTSEDLIENNEIGVHVTDVETSLEDLDVRHSSQYGVLVTSGTLHMFNSTVEFSATSDFRVGGNASINLTNTYFNKGNTGFEEYAQNLQVKWYLDLKVLADLDIPWVNGTVVIKNRTGQEVFNGTTDSYGKIPTQIITEYIQDMGEIDPLGPYEIIASSTDARVYISKSRDMIIYNRGDMDADGIPDSLEEAPGVIWYDAEGHGYGELQMVSDALALDYEAIGDWNGTGEIINNNTFFDMFMGSPEIMVMVRARSTSPGDNLTLVVTDLVGAEVSNETFCLERDYFWYYTNWFPNPDRLFIRGYIPGNAAGDVLVDSICIVPRQGDGRPMAVEGQITDPCNSDTDGDRMPDGDERRNSTVWFEAEFGINVSLTTLTSNEYSNGHAVQFAPADPPAMLSFDLTSYLARDSLTGQMAKGNYTLKIRAHRTVVGAAALIQYSGNTPYTGTLAILNDTPTWYTLLNLAIDTADMNPILTISHMGGTFVVDKIGIVMMVDVPDQNWCYNFTSPLTQLQTPSIVGDIVVSTSASIPHIVGIDGVTGQVRWNVTYDACAVTSPTVYGNDVFYAYDSGMEIIISCIDALTGQVLWSNTSNVNNEILGQAILDIPTRINGVTVDEQVVLGATNRLESFNASSGQLLWAYDLPGNISSFISMPVVFGEYILLIGNAMWGGSQERALMINSTGIELWSAGLNDGFNQIPIFGTPTVHNGKFFISRIPTDGPGDGRVEAYSLNPDTPAVLLWTASMPPPFRLATEPITGNGSVIVLAEDGLFHKVVMFNETDGSTAGSPEPPMEYFAMGPKFSEMEGFMFGSSTSMPGSVLSRSPCFVEGRIYYLTATYEYPDPEIQSVHLKCVDLNKTVNREEFPMVFDRLLGTQYEFIEVAGTPVLGDLDGDGYLDIAFNVEQGTCCHEGGGVWYRAATPWKQYHREEHNSGDGVYEYRFFPTDPVDLDMDHDELADGLEEIFPSNAERFEFEDLINYSVTYMGSDWPEDAMKKNIAFFHQTGVSLRTVDPDSDPERVDEATADSWIEVEFQVPVTGIYDLKVEPVNGFEDKSKALGLKGGGNGGGLYTNSGDGYSYSAGDTDAVGDAGFVDWWPVEQTYLERIIENATYFGLSCQVNSTNNTIGYIPLELPPGSFRALPTAIRQPVFDFTQVYIQGYFQATISTALSAGTTYYLKVGLDLDRVPSNLLENFPLSKDITRIDILDIDFCLARHYGVDPFVKDCDGDTLEDGNETYEGSFPWSSDTDEDGISDPFEFVNGTDPCYRDSDFDGLRDRVEGGLSNVDTDPYTCWDTQDSKASMWEMMMAYCDGDAGRLNSSTLQTSPNWDADTNTTTDPTDPDSDDDGMPDGSIDGWGYDPVADSRGQYTSQADNLYLYDKAFDRPYEERYWGFVGTSDNIPQVWEGEDFDLDGGQDSDGPEWGFEIEDGKVGRKTGNDETDATKRDTDGDLLSDGWEVLYSQSLPFLRVDDGQLRYSLNPTQPGDAWEDIDVDPEQVDEVGADPGFNLTLGPGCDYGYAMKYGPSQDTVVEAMEVELYPTTGVEADVFELEIFPGSIPYITLKQRMYRMTYSISSTDGEDGMYRFDDLNVFLNGSLNYWITIRYRSASFVLPLNTSQQADAAVCDEDGDWTEANPKGPFHMVLYNATAGGDDLTNIQEYAAGTNPKRMDTDEFRRKNVQDSDGLNDSQECQWVLRSNAENGSLRYGGYLNATYIHYDGDAGGSDHSTINYTRTDGQDLYTDPAYPFPGAGSDMILLYRLKDNTEIFLNQSGPTGEHAIYVWKPYSSPTSTSEHENGSRYYKGECVKFTRTGTASPSNYTPELAFRYTYLFLADPFDIDTDDDGIRDGMEVDWDKDCVYSAAEGSSADTLNNARDRDSDNDGWMDQQEINYSVDLPADWITSFDLDSYENMVDADSDGDGVKDGDELWGSFDTDKDGAINVFDCDSDNDGLPDGWRDNVTWNETNGTFDNVTAGVANAFDLWEGEDVNTNGVYDKSDNETNPTMVDTDQDGLSDGYDNATALGELTLHTNRGGLTQTEYPNRTMWDTDGDGLSDGAEILGWTIDIKYPDGVIISSFVSRFYASDPCINDSDGDGLFDGVEYLFSNPWTNDTDEDGWYDDIEDGNGNGLVDAGETSPRNADTDGDTLPDGFVWTNWGDGGFYWGEDRNQNNKSDSGTETHPLNPDTDGDMVSDGAEFAISITLNFTGGGFGDHDLDGTIDILDTDSDNDGLTDWEENCDQHPRLYDDTDDSFETNPLNADTDGDGLYDGAEPARQSDADSDGITNGHDNDSNNDNKTDYNQTFVIFRTNAVWSASTRTHDYNQSGVWVAVDTNVSIWHHSEDNEDHNLSLVWDNAGYIFDGYSDTKPDDIEKVNVSKRLLNGNYTEKRDVTTPERYSVYHNDSGFIVIEVPDSGSNYIYYIFEHTGNEQESYESSKKSVGSFVYTHSESYDYRPCLSDDSDMDGLANSVDLVDDDADIDDDGVADGMEILWNTDSDDDGLLNYLDPDSDNDGVTDGTEMGYTLPLTDCSEADGTDVDATFTNSSRKNWTADSALSSRTCPIKKDTDGDGLYDGWNDLDHNGIFTSNNESKGETTLDGWDATNSINGKVDSGEADPLDVDTDDDGLSDGGEQFTFGTKPLDNDTDDDGLLDGLELGRIDGISGTDMSLFRPDGDPNTTTNATSSDTDDDNFEDGFEDADRDGVRDWNETDPTTNDTDGDGIWDSVEDNITNRKVDVDNSTNRYLETDPLCADTDGDGISDGDEDKNHNGIFEPDNENPDLKETNPRWQDTDNDSLSDGLEIGGWNISVYFEATGEKRSGYPIVVDSNPWIVDTDDDGLTDGQEFENATHPRSHDTDGDGMTDLWELTGPAPSDPCGVEGTPPNLSDLHVNTEVEWEVRWVGVGRAAIPMYFRTRNEINVTVTATDNVGLKWIRFHIDGKDDETARFAQNTNNSTVTVFLKHDLWSKWVAGYDLNISVSDVNGNEGYMEFHIDSALEAFVQWLIGQVTALAKFVMELASAAIEWVWKMIEDTVNSFIASQQESFFRYANNLIATKNNVYKDENSTMDESEELDIINAIFGPYFVSIVSVFTIILLIMSIIKFFIVWMSWLLTAAIIAILTVFTYVIALQFSGDDISESSAKDVSSLSIIQMFISLFENSGGSRHAGAASQFEDITSILMKLEMFIALIGFGYSLYMARSSITRTSAGILACGLGLFLLGLFFLDSSISKKYHSHNITTMIRGTLLQDAMDFDLWAILVFFTSIIIDTVSLSLASDLNIIVLALSSIVLTSMSIYVAALAYFEHSAEFNAWYDYESDP